MDRLQVALLGLLMAGKDGSHLRFALGQALFRDGDTKQALDHLKQAVVLDPNYTAAWALLGKAQLAARMPDEALASWETGTLIAERRGDMQALRQMRVWQQRLNRDGGVRSA